MAKFTVNNLNEDFIHSGRAVEEASLQTNGSWSKRPALPYLHKSLDGESPLLDAALASLVSSRFLSPRQSKAVLTFEFITT